jgi:hypothetical protein
MPSYSHGKGGERGIEQGAMSEGRIRVGVWLTIGDSGEQKRTDQQHVGFGAWMHRIITSKNQE